MCCIAREKVLCGIFCWHEGLTTGWRFVANDKWDNKTCPCIHKWRGVVCDSVGHIVALNLAGWLTRYNTRVARKISMVEICAASGKWVVRGNSTITWWDDQFRETILSKQQVDRRCSLFCQYIASFEAAVVDDPAIKALLRNVMFRLFYHIPCFSFVF